MLTNTVIKLIRQRKAVLSDKYVIVNKRCIKRSKKVIQQLESGSFKITNGIAKRKRSITLVNDQNKKQRIGDPIYDSDCFNLVG